ncbi:TolC family protein [Cryomorpha ignava]|uniref:TolC family protein n=1 Tax=Cryomorpha ignava TaxID=101383 RepID=A0A7K3WNB4_9FLAO|nr:TolC family protein [Cryomorpha ignava]NEN23140.1 TolC family protein [Cryomorpha ignava]
MMSRILTLLGLILLSSIATAQSLSLSLAEAQQMAIDSSYATRNARYNTEKKRKEVREVLANGFPQINGTAELQDFLKIPTQLVPAEFFGGEQGEFAEIQFGTKYNFTAGLSATQLIFDGTYLIGIKASKTVVELTTNQELKSEQDIKFNVAEAYHTVLLAIENLNILQENLGNFQKTLDDTQALYDNGLTEQQDVDQIKLNKNQITINIDRTQQFLEVSRKTLNFLIGIDLDRQITLTDNIENLVQVSNDQKYLEIEPQLNTHPDYLIAKTNLEIQDLTIRGNKAAYYPSLSGFFNYQQTALRNEFNFTDTDQPWFPTSIIGLRLNVPIWSSLQRRARVQQAEIGFQQSVMQLQQTEESLKLGVDRARSNYENALKTWGNQKESIALAQSISEKTNIKYSEGISSSFELNVAESQLLNEQTKYIQAAMDLLTAKQNLDRALNIN